MSTQQKETKPIVYVIATIAAIGALWLVWDTFSASTQRSNTDALDESIEELQRAREKNK